MIASAYRTSFITLIVGLSFFLAGCKDRYELKEFDGHLYRLNTMNGELDLVNGESFVRVQEKKIGWRAAADRDEFGSPFSPTREPIQIKDDKEFYRLAPNTLFKAPDGTIRVTPKSHLDVLMDSIREESAKRKIEWENDPIIQSQTQEIKRRDRADRLLKNLPVQGAADTTRVPDQAK